MEEVEGHFQERFVSRSKISEQKNLYGIKQTREIAGQLRYKSRKQWIDRQHMVQEQLAKHLLRTTISITKLLYWFCCCHLSSYLSCCSPDQWGTLYIRHVIAQH